MGSCPTSVFPWVLGRGGGDSPSGSPLGSVQRAAGRLVGLHTNPAAPWQHCGSWRGSVSAVEKEERLEAAGGGHPRPGQKGHPQNGQKAGQIIQLYQPPLYTRPGSLQQDKASNPLQRLEPGKEKEGRSHQTSKCSEDAAAGERSQRGFGRYHRVSPRSW